MNLIIKMVVLIGFLIALKSFDSAPRKVTFEELKIEKCNHVREITRDMPNFKSNLCK